MVDTPEAGLEVLVAGQVDFFVRIEVVYRLEFVRFIRLSRVSLAFIPYALSIKDLRFDAFVASALVSEP